MATLWKFLVLVCLVQHIMMNTSSSSEESVASLQTHERALHRVFTAVNRLLSFFDDRHKDMIVDSIFGIRVLQGALNRLLKSIRNGEIKIKGVNKLHKEIRNLYIQASGIATKSVNFAEDYNPEYFETVGFTAKTEWDVFRQFQPLNLNLALPTSTVLSSESILDECFGSLIGNKLAGLKPCTITQKCWKINTTPGATGYVLTHQLLYFMLGQKIGCTKVFNMLMKKSRLNGGIEGIFASRCASMYPQMQEQERIALKNNSLEDIDLYLEQCIVCGMLGYGEFLSLTRLQYILNWQHPQGCYGFHGDIKRPEDDVDDDELNTDNERDVAKTTMRKLQVSRALEGGCEMHISGVVAGLLGIYISWHIHHINWEELVSKKLHSRSSINLNNLESWTKFSLFLLMLAMLVFIFSKRRLCHRLISVLNFRY